MLIGLSYLAAWSLQKDASPRQYVALDPLGLKYETCTITEWNFISMACKNFFEYKYYVILNFEIFISPSI